MTRVFFAGGCGFFRTVSIRIPYLAGGLVAIACAATSAGCQSLDPDDRADLLLAGATVIDGTGAPPRRADVLVRGGRIAAVGAPGEIDVSAGTRRMDLAGRFLVPGFVDTHAHVTVLRWSRDSAGALAGTYDRAVSETVLRVLLAHGITTVRNPGAPAAEGVALRDAVARGEIPGPRIVTAGDILADARMSGEAVRAEVRRQAGLGVDLVKVYARLPPALVAAAVDEAHARGIRVVGHLQRTTWADAARLGIDAVTHGAPWSPESLPPERRAAYRQTLLGRLDWLEWVDPDGPEMRETIRLLAERRIPLDPTLIAFHTRFFGDDPRHTDNPAQRLVPEIAADWRAAGSHTGGWTPADFARARRLWPRMLALVRRYHAAGVLLTAGSDLPNPWVVPGESFHRELELLADAGIPAADVLAIATRNGAAALGLLAETGTVEPGRRADLVVLSADPLRAIANTRRIELVIQDGRVLRPADLLRDPVDDPADSNR